MSNRALPQAGYYASNPAAAGQTFTTQTGCPPGNYCPGNGQKYACPAGKYGSNSQFWQNNQCEGNCAAGYNCPAGSIAKFQEACAPDPTNLNAARTYYCPAGQGRQSINTATEYTTPEIAQAGFRTGKATCGANEFCSNGRRQPRISWTGNWASCAGGGSATFTFAEGQDENGDGTTGDYTTVAFTSSSPAGGVSASTSGGGLPCRSTWTHTNTQTQFEFSGTTLRLKDTVKTAGGLNFEDCRPPSGYSLRVRATVGSYTEDCQVTILIGDVSFFFSSFFFPFHFSLFPLPSPPSPSHTQGLNFCAYQPYDSCTR